MIGAAAARSAARRRSKQAAIHDQQSKVRQQAALDIIKRYDVNSNMHIDKDGLTRMLRDANKNTPVTDDVLRWCRAVAHYSDGNASPEGEFVEITYAGALAAVDAFYAYQENEPTIVDLFQKYDKDKSGMLSTEELKQLLTDLNDGDSPSAEELRWIQETTYKRDGNAIPSAGVNKAEVMFSISLWYSVLEQDEKNSKSACAIC
mmetsp:Transcript_17928/g.30136  ORF Transcript_17928/g.30136 Transcript_17928/m.30136 type:complete len:204 (+) Transcript_17928:176-787(+)